MVEFSPKPVPRRKSELPPGIKSEPSYFDRNGNRYSSLNECIIGQIAIIIGQKRDGPEGQPNIAKLIANKAHELIPLLNGYQVDEQDSESKRRMHIVGTADSANLRSAAS